MAKSLREWRFASFAALAPVPFLRFPFLRPEPSLAERVIPSLVPAICADDSDRDITHEAVCVSRVGELGSRASTSVVSVEGSFEVSGGAKCGGTEEG